MSCIQNKRRRISRGSRGEIRLYRATSNGLANSEAMPGAQSRRQRLSPISSAAEGRNSVVIVYAAVECATSTSSFRSFLPNNRRCYPRYSCAPRRECAVIFARPVQGVVAPLHCDILSLRIIYETAFITAPSTTTPAVTYFQSATSSLRASATIVVLRRRPPLRLTRSLNHCASAEFG